MADTALANQLAPVDIQSARPDAHESVKAKANAPTNRIDQKHADNPIDKIFSFSILGTVPSTFLSISANLTSGEPKSANPL
jgi:hypothetical protein